MGGYEPREVMGRSIMEFTYPDDLPAAAEALATVLRVPDTPHPAKIRWLARNGSVVTLESIAKNELANPALRAIVINARDATARLHAEDEIKRYVGELENAFMQSVTVATTICEMRDPYTVGHERRVAELAVAIGAELGFDTRRLEGLKVAGFLHDVGKITVPAEILVKPTKLSPTEFELIKGHAQASYDVLKTVTFPWPVAEIAYQHHERLDGSGYPRRLKGDAILLEARILAVADTVEAMQSHRPYRAGLGIDKALAEIKRGRGSGYDPAVVDACLNVFAEKRFAFSV
jgi:PAS domain S-box-containing protein